LTPRDRSGHGLVPADVDPRHRRGPRGALRVGHGGRVLEWCGRARWGLGREAQVLMSDVEVPAHCGRPMVPIAYGMPGPELIEASGRGELSLGGCVLGPDSPALECSACGATAGELGDDVLGGDRWD